MQRQFTSGSRQAPDPYDQFLEMNNFYRKHTARDASCLFRVISEQMYDTQQHHLVIREKCVNYMRKHHKFFKPLIDRDLDEYLDDMSKPKTYGTLIELQALGYMFQRNVLLFEPFDLGTYFTTHRAYFNNVFRVFYTPERHFDSVFTADFIQDAALCQSIVYEILYKDLYKLPDVTFAVEQMLHSPTFESTGYRTECNEAGYCTRIYLDDGRVFDFDLPHNTNCILENYKLCHFHYINFPRLSDDLQRELKVYTQREDYDKSALSKTAESLLPNKYISCVRQLLQEGITPFPYKVAKALDPTMYRNIEFDAWNEARKELKLQNWYNGDSNFKVGAKCHVKLCKSENDLYTCHIQEMAVDKGNCIVFIEQLGEKRTVPYDSLTPLPQDEFKPWALPYRFQRHMHKYSSVRFTRQCNYRFKLNGQFSTMHDYCSTPLSHMKGDMPIGVDHDDDDPKQQQRNACYYKLKQYTHLENFAHTFEVCAMPIALEHTGLEQTTDGKVTQRPGAQSNDNSRAPSRTSVVTAGTEHTQHKSEHGLTDDACAVLEHYGLEQGADGGGYMPEFNCVYPVQHYGIGPDECVYQCGYDGSIPPPTAFMPAGNTGTFYYMCNAGPAGYAAAANNLYMQAPLQASHSLITAAPSSAQNISYYHNPYYPNVAAIPSSAVPPSGTPATLTRSHAPNTPLTGRINWDAKKSVKANGVDLPQDVATLRYFYNLGLDFHHKQLKRNADFENTMDNKDNLALEMQNIKLDENANLQESKSEINNNNMPNLNNVNINGSTVAHVQNPQTTSNQNQTTNFNAANKSNHSSRRFPSRYFNSKERQAYQRSLAAANANNANVVVTGATTAHQHNRNQQDFSSNNGNSNNRNNNKNGNATTTTPNMLRNQIQNTNSGAAGNANGGGYMAISIADQNVQTTPTLGLDTGEMTQTQTTTYNSIQNPIVTYGSYEYGADPNALTTAHLGPPPPPNGVYIQMPMAPPSYGIYAGPPPPMGNASYPPYMGVLPGGPTSTAGTVGAPNINGGFYSTASACGPEIGDNGMAGDGGSAGAMHFQCNYPPPMPFYYAPPGVALPAGPPPSNMNAVGGNMPPQASATLPPPPPIALSAPMLPHHQSALGSQAYWCVQQNTMPAQQPIPPTQNTSGNNSGNVAAMNANAANVNAVPQIQNITANSNRRDKQQQQINDCI